MRRAFALLAIACLAGAAAGRVSPAKADKRTAPSELVSTKPEAPCPVPPRFRAAFRHAAAQTGMPTALLVAVARVESNLRQEARSEAGARGLLQVMPATAVSLELDPDQPASNILAGARYLRLLFDRFESADLALAAYNAGPTAVARAGGAPTAETLTYVANVTRVWRSLAGCT